MKRTKRERKAYNEGKRTGYAEGYAKGFYDGNPFNALIEAANGIVKAFTDNPELLKEALEAQQEYDELLIEDNEEGE